MGHLFQAIETIRLGILENDMAQVSTGFELLTGQKVSGQHLEEPEAEQAYEVDVEEKQSGPSFITGIKNNPPDAFKASSSSDRTNKFIDDGSVKTDEERGYEAIDDSVAPVPRTRKKFEKVEQRCHSCGKTDMVNPQHRRDFYKCEKCITRR
tara:strand:+ start:24172 stop:24627 length:456 start_codon:yes stop_codon:yes gene_type:complete